ISCTNAEDGAVSVSLSNGPVVDIEWNTGADGTELSNLDAGLYSFTGTDIYGCTFSGEVTIIEPASLFAQGLTTDALCYGTATGSVDFQTLGGTPPFSADWMGEDPEALEAGTYSGMITDSHGCTANFNYTIGQPDSLSIVVDVDHASE